jgi:uncharacterized protein
LLEPPPAPTARLNDYAGVLTAADRDRIERLLTERERATGAQMAIAIFPSLQGGSLEDFSIRLAERWRVGDKGLDRGVILVAFVEDRRMRLEVGYGLEPVIPDAVAGRIIRDAIAPRFREGRYAAGLEAGVVAVYARVHGGEPAEPAARPSVTLTSPVVMFLGLMVLIALLVGADAYRARRFVGRRGYTAGRRGWEPMVLPGPGWGGGWHGGGGGSSGGGGFSPGGGSFGGGGASGEW